MASCCVRYLCQSQSPTISDGSPWFLGSIFQSKPSQPVNPGCPQQPEHTWERKATSSRPYWWGLLLVCDFCLHGSDWDLLPSSSRQISPSFLALKSTGSILWCILLSSQNITDLLAFMLEVGFCLFVLNKRWKVFSQQRHRRCSVDPCGWSIHYTPVWNRGSLESVKDDAPPEIPAAQRRPISKESFKII